MILIPISLIPTQYSALLSKNQVVERILYIYAKLNPGLGYVQVRDLIVLLFLMLHDDNKIVKKLCISLYTRPLNGLVYKLMHNFVHGVIELSII